MEISKDLKVKVLGAGKIGMSIVQAFAQKSFEIVGIDINEDILKIGLNRVGQNLNMLVSKNKINSKNKNEILKRIKLSSDFNELKDGDIVIEAVFEDIMLKKDLFKKMDELVASPEALPLTNTSSLCVTEIASVTKRPEQMAGMHFFNPVPVMKLVEIVKGVETSEKTIEQVKELAKLLDKIPIVSKDSPGFIVNRMLNAFTMETCRIVADGVGSPEDVDAGAKFGLGHPMGPFELFDTLDGIPLLVHVCEYMAEELGEWFRPPTWIKNYVRAGRIGRSSGKGIYDYTKKG